MSPRHLLGSLLLLGFAANAFGQTPVDFARDVRPIFSANCIGCHGPAQQAGGLRLDQRTSAMAPGTRRIVPGGSANSFVYLKLIGEGLTGLAMPPAGPLRREQIDVIKTWIDQGAPWPDALAGDQPAAPPDAAATQMLIAIREADRRSLRRLVRDRRDAVNQRGAGGSTPLAAASLYSDVEAARLLLEHGGDPNTRSAGEPTPLAIASLRYGSFDLVKLLLDHGATPEVDAVANAAYAGDETVLRLLLERGGDAKAAAPFALWSAMRANCAGCIDALLDATSRPALDVTLAMLAPFGETSRLMALLDRGANVNVRLAGIRKDVDGRTPLMLAANSQRVPADTVRMLLDRGADANARGPRGETALDLAARSGNTTVVELLKKAGAVEGGVFPRRTVVPKPAGGVRAAVTKSLALLQRSETVSKSGCVSCHNDTFTLMAVAAARANGLPVDEPAAARHLATIESQLSVARDQVLIGVNACQLPEAPTYLLVGLAAQDYRPSPATDALALCLKSRQSSDGRWRAGLFDLRPPMQSTDVTLTGFTIRALRAYAPKARRADYDRSVRAAAKWLSSATAETNDERVSRVLGLRWAGALAPDGQLRAATRDLLAQQRPDGGWAQISTLASDAYATGQALYALRESGALSITDDAYRRGVRFLLDSQLEDGSWYVQSRSIPFQPAFESGFPHGPDQWVSAAATNWAVLALVPAHNMKPSSP